MTLKTDENLPLDAAVTLREHGFDVETIWDEGLSGADDAMVARRAQAEGRILLTLDLDFANIQAYPPDQHAGITVLRLGVQDRATVITYIRRLAAMLRQRSPTGELWIIERDRVRFRRSD